MTSGGTEATFTALLAARASWRPEAWTQGFGDGPVPVVLCGEHAHYAVQRAVGAMGLGTANCLAVASDGFRMSPVALEARLDALAKELVTPVENAMEGKEKAALPEKGR